MVGCCAAGREWLGAAGREWLGAAGQAGMAARRGSAAGEQGSDGWGAGGGGLVVGQLADGGGDVVDGAEDGPAPDAVGIPELRRDLAPGLVFQDAGVEAGAGERVLVPEVGERDGPQVVVLGEDGLLGRCQPLQDR